jgi:TolB-like protein
LEALADPGGICISKAAFDQIETKLPLGYEYLGEQTVKNIAKPVGAYRVVLEPRITVVGASKKKVPFGQRQLTLAIAVIVILLVGVLALWQFLLRPSPPSSVAVLPFANMSEDPRQEFFSDGMTEEIITALSKSPYLFVIARNSTSTYKGKPVKVKQVAEDLGVRYVLEGSVRRSGDKVRITAQLIDAVTGHHLWSERFDRDLKDIFTLQDDVASRIMSALHAKMPAVLRQGETGRGTRNVEAFLKGMEATDNVFRYTREGNARARSLYEEVIAFDP